MTDATIIDAPENSDAPGAEEIARELARQEALNAVIPVPIIVHVNGYGPFATDPDAGPQAAYLGENGSVGIIATGKFQHQNAETTDAIFPWNTIAYVELLGTDEEEANVADSSSD